MIPCFHALCATVCLAVTPHVTAVVPTGFLKAEAALAGVQEEPAWIGCWSSVGDEGESWWFEGERVGHVKDGVPAFYRAVHTDTGAWIERWARARTLELSVDGDRLTVGDGEDARTFVRSEEVPLALRVPAYELPDDVELDEETRAVLTDDLRSRRAEDQRVRTNPSAQGEMSRVDEDNTEFLVAVIQEVGWIDATRFGAETSEAAFLLVQHSSDLRLLQTALPWIQADVEAGLLRGQPYALLFDRLRLNLGYPQRYGSQLGGTADGEYVLMPCEDFDRVDELRAALGMGPLADYLKLFEEDGEPVRRAEEVLSPPGD